MSTPTKIGFLGIVFLLAGIGLGIGTYIVGKTKTTIASSGIPAVAKVLSAEHRKGCRGRNSHFLQLQYPLKDGQIKRLTIQVPDDVYARADAESMLNIKYAAENPAEVVFTDFPYSATERYVIGAILAVVGLAIAVLAFRARRHATVASAEKS